MKKTAIITIILLLILDIFLGVSYYVKNSKNKILYPKEKIEIGYNTNLPNVDSYFENYEDEEVKSITYSLNGSEVSTDKLELGSYDVEIVVNNRVYNSKLEVLDMMPPAVKEKKLIIYEGDKYKIESFIEKCTDDLSECIYTYTDKGMGEYKNSGTYDISIRVTDSSDNETVVNTTLTIMNRSTNLTTNNLKNDALELVKVNESDIINIFNGVNKYRNEIGLKSYELNDNLTLGATIRALEMVYANKFSHTRPNGKSCFTVLRELGYNKSYYGENIASANVYTTALSLWRNSLPHYKNMTSKIYNKIGIGKANYKKRTYWVLMFSN